MRVSIASRTSSTLAKARRCAKPNASDERGVMVVLTPTGKSQTRTGSWSGGLSGWPGENTASVTLGPRGP
ncbi:MAG: hypothetical protein WDM85_19945 [Caulobacteraceae bacterium]